MQQKSGSPVQQAPPPKDLVVRPLQPEDREAWLRLWAGYNAFYGRSGETALPDAVTEYTWQRCVGEGRDLCALVALVEGEVAGLVHFLFHEVTTSLDPVCYLSDIYTDESVRKRGVGRALIEEVYRAALRRGAGRVYWQTQASNETARELYDRLAENSGFIVYRKSLDDSGRAVAYG